MKTKNTKIWIIGLILLFTHMLNPQDLIPSSHQVPWHSAGLLSDVSTYPVNPIIVVSNTDDDYEAILDAIDTAKNQPGIDIIYFPAGNYYIDHTIELDPSCSDLVFQGAG